MNKILYLFMIVLILSGSTSASDDGWIELFNGKDLTGWKQLNGEAKYEVVDNMIVGTTVANPYNSFLCTEQNYSDFILEVDLLVEENMNSGIQFRSESKADYKNGRVHGYQCEVDPSDRAWSAGIYDESRRGWLYPLELNPAARSALKTGEWNKYRIECIGNSIKTWLNGVPVAHLIDDMTPEGFIALQVHGIRNNNVHEGQQIKWKNIRIKTENLELSPNEGIYTVNLISNNLSKAEKERGFKLLFDGQTTDNFKSVEGDEFPSKGWGVKDGELIILANEGDTDKRGESIITKEEFGFFELKFDFMFAKEADSGIKYGLGNNGSSVGLEYQILDAKNGIEGNRTLASLFDLIPAKMESWVANDAGEWNRGRIVLYPDNRVEHWLNGRKVVEFTRGSEQFKELLLSSKFADIKGFGMAERGPVYIQNHGGEVHFRSIKIRKL